MASNTPSLAEMTWLKTIGKTGTELWKMKEAVDKRNARHQNNRENNEELNEAFAITMKAKRLLEGLSKSKGDPDLVDAFELEITLPKVLGFWRTFEIISEDDEELLRPLADEIVARYKPKA